MNRLVAALFCCALVGELGWLAHRVHQYRAHVESLCADVRRDMDSLHQSVLLVRADVEDLQVRVNAAEDRADGGGAP